jgi:CheY-like chemotaxis protein/MinD-like ATPase involved in chromosome partitioning or flagellar assembly
MLDSPAILGLKGDGRNTFNGYHLANSIEATLLRDLMPEKILVVDDDVDSLKLIGLMLKRQGYEVVAASAGMPALQKAYAEMPDLIILDVMMPDMDGYEVCSRLRAEPKTKDIPIIMFTAKTLVDDKVKGFEVGADDYLTKPTHPAELASRVKAVLTRRQQQAQQKGPSAPAASPTPSSMTIGFLGVKGGVGTSTITAAVGGIIARDFDTILTDLRPGQGTLGAMLGVQNAQGIANVMRYSVNDITPALVSNQAVRHASGMRLVLSSINPQESQLNISPEAAFALVKAMSSVARFSLVDMGAGLNRVNVRLIRDLTQTVVILEPNRPSVMSAQAILREFRTIGVPPHKVVVVVSNRTQTNAQLGWQEIESGLGHQISALVGPAPELVYQAVEAATPLTLFQPDAIIAGQVNKLVQELAKHGA